MPAAFLGDHSLRQLTATAKILAAIAKHPNATGYFTALRWAGAGRRVQWCLAASRCHGQQSAGPMRGEAPAGFDPHSKLAGAPMLGSHLTAAALI